MGSEKFYLLTSFPLLWLCTTPIMIIINTHIHPCMQLHIHHIFRNPQGFLVLRRWFSITAITSCVFLQLFFTSHFVLHFSSSCEQHFALLPLTLVWPMLSWYKVIHFQKISLKVWDPSLFLPSFPLSLTQISDYLTVRGIVFQ